MRQKLFFSQHGPARGEANLWYNPCFCSDHPFAFQRIHMSAPSPPHQVTVLLAAWRAGDQSALERLLPLVSGELHHLAANYMRREHAGHTLQTTALVNEAYLRLAGEQRGVEWQDRAHFFAAAATVMRHILVDHARRHHRVKRGGAGAHKVSLDEAAAVSPISSERSAELIALDEALARLAAVDARQCQVVELRYFSGLTVEETAEVLKVSAVTVMREWRMAKTWLAREIEAGGCGGDDA